MDGFTVAAAMLPIVEKFSLFQPNFHTPKSAAEVLIPILHKEAVMCDSLAVHLLRGQTAIMARGC